MIDYEGIIFNRCCKALRDEFGAENIYITGAELLDTPPRFPAVSVIQIDNRVNLDGSTLNRIEKAVKSTFEVQAYSNLDAGGGDEVRKIVEIVDSVLSDNGYYRIYNKPLLNVADYTITRRVAQWRCDVLTETFQFKE